MGVRKIKPTFKYSMLLALLMLSVCATYFTFHNIVATTITTINLWPIVFTLVSLVIGLIFYLSLTRILDSKQKTTEQFDQLKKVIEQSKNAQNGKNKVETKTQEHFNAEEEANKLLPKENFENLELFAEQLLKNIAKTNEIVQGTYFAKNEKNSKFNFIAGYAFYSETKPHSFVEGETLPGQVAKNREPLLLDQIPDEYIIVLSGLGKGSPKYLLIVPIIDEAGACVGVFELASFKPISENKVQMFTSLGKLLDPLLKKTANLSQE